MHRPFLPEIEPPRGLYSAILTRISEARQRSARFRFVAFSALALISVVVLVPVAQYALSEFYASGFYEFASLFFDSVAQGYAGELLYSLVDALPSLALLLFASVGAVFVWSLTRASRDARLTFTRPVIA
jgi:hypothetical protein